MEPARSQQRRAGTAKLQITLASGLKKTVTVKVQKTAVKTTKVTVANTKVTVKKGKKVALKPVVNSIHFQAESYLYKFQQEGCNRFL